MCHALHCGGCDSQRHRNLLTQYCRAYVPLGHVPQKSGTYSVSARIQWRIRTIVQRLINKLLYRCKINCDKTCMKVCTRNIFQDRQVLQLVFRNCSFNQMDCVNDCATKTFTKKLHVQCHRAQIYLVSVKIRRSILTSFERKFAVYLWIYLLNASLFNFTLYSAPAPLL